MMTINKQILNRHILLIIFLLTIVVKNPALAQKDISQTDYEALVAFYNATDGPNWDVNTHWLDTLTPTNQWHGVDAVNNHVTKIELNGNKLTGTIPPQIGNLTNLWGLSLTHNNITGPLPDLSNLTLLKYLHLSDNDLSGPIPDWIGKLSSLQQLFLDSNLQLGGTIPDSLYELSSLEILKLNGCGLSGAISANIQNLNNLQTLELHENQLTGIIPPEIGELSSLTLLNITENQLSGQIPGEICKLTNLEYLYLNYNKLEGMIPVDIGNLTNLFHLYLDHNQLTGNIPDGIGQLASLTELSLGFNTLEGTIPSQINDLSNLTRLLLDWNHLSGSIPTEIGKLTKLQLIYLHKNQLEGPIPESIGSLENLKGLNLWSNKLTGSIPTGIVNLKEITDIQINENNLSGQIPVAIENLAKLELLRLDSNQLSGNIPEGLFNLKELRSLQIQNNYFDEMHNLSNVSFQLLCENNLLTFEDLERNIALIGKLGSNFDYSPQRDFGREDTIIVTEGTSYKLRIPCGGDHNIYTWYKDGSRIKNDSSFFYFSPIQFSNSGTYKITVENSVVTGLTLKSRPVYLKVVESCIKSDSLALKALYQATGGLNWKYKTNWLVDGKPLNTWVGITTNNCSVLGISLPGNNLTDTIPAELYTLTNLNTLNLSENKLEGNISPKIEQLVNLQTLSLRGNSLTGPLPKEIGNLTNLLQLALSGNQLSGTIPPEVGNLKNLLGLNFANNQLSGSIPPEIGNLKNIQYLALDNNQISGNIPPEIGKLTCLNSGLLLGNNRLTGVLPPEIGYLTQLEELTVDSNYLTGTIPITIQKLKNLHKFQFQNNLLSEIPALPSINSLIYCYNNYLTFEDFERNLDLVRKKVAGKVDFQYSPQYKFGKKYSITITEDSPFSLSIPCGGIYNNYTWFKDNESIYTDTITSSLFFPSIQLTDAGTYFITVTNDSVPGLTLTSEPVTVHVKKHCIKNDSLALVALYYATNGPNWTNHTNWLEKGKPVSAWYGIIETDSCSVLKIDLTNNNLTGNISGIDSITEGFEYFKQLNHLYLGQNKLYGNIPNAVGGYSELEELNLSENGFEGEIPPSLGKLAKLTTLDLGGNMLEGEIPAEIYNLAELKRLVLTTNKLSGKIPSEIRTLLKLEVLGLGDNRFDGSIQGELVNLIKLTDLDLHKNNFSGSIPTSIGYLYNLEKFNLSENHLTGIVPSTIGNLTDLTFLAINNNELEGDIPQEIRKLVNLKSFHIEYNFLEGLPVLPKIDTLFWSNDNYLTFEDFELNLSIIKNKKTDLVYSPQYKFGREDTITAYEGTPFTLSIPTGGIYNHYTWNKNNFDLKDTTDAYKLYFPAIQLADAGIYYIKVENDSVTELTLQSKSVHIIILNKPTLYSSNCGLINRPLSDTLTWNKVAWADSYGLQVSTSPDFNNTILDARGITKNSYIISNLEYGTTYYWRVNASDSIGTTGWSDVCNFTTLPEIPDPPLLESACDGPEIQDLSNSVSWYSSDRAESYTLQVSTSSDFSTLFLNESKITSTSYTISGLDFNTTYYWRVNATNITGTSKWSTVCNFKTYQPELSFINLVIIDGQHSPLFMIEGIKYNPDNNLSVFTKWGKKVYSKTGYNNELDFSSYPSGTYYYVLNVKVNGVPKQYKSFVDVVKQ
jgi:Leucine-rich repeat (LRR) protein